MNNNFIDRFHRLESETIGFKSSQAYGNGVTKSYVTESELEWDLNQTSSSPPGQSWYPKYGTLSVIFTADTQPAALTTFELKILIDNVEFHKSSKKHGSIYWILYSGFQSQYSADKDISKYQTGIDFPWGVGSSTNLKVKVRAISTDTGKLITRTTVGGS